MFSSCGKPQLKGDCIDSLWCVCFWIWMNLFPGNNMKPIFVNIHYFLNSCLWFVIKSRCFEGKKTPVSLDLSHFVIPCCDILWNVFSPIQWIRVFLFGELLRGGSLPSYCVSGGRNQSIQYVWRKCTSDFCFPLQACLFLLLQFSPN